MLYSEFIDRVGEARTVEDYHAKVESEYYDFPGNKDEFCLQFIDRELHRVNDVYMKYRKYLEEALIANDEEQIEAFTGSLKIWDEVWHELMKRRQALIKLMYN